MARRPKVINVDVVETVSMVETMRREIASMPQIDKYIAVMRYDYLYGPHTEANNETID